MSEPIDLTVTEREKLGVLVNNLSMFAAQLVTCRGTDVPMQALANLAKLKKECEPLLKRIDELARHSGDESALRLIEDLPRMPRDLLQALNIIQRCLLASAFLGHCLAQPVIGHLRCEEEVAEGKRLH